MLLNPMTKLKGDSILPISERAFNSLSIKPSRNSVKSYGWACNGIWVSHTLIRDNNDLGCVQHASPIYKVQFQHGQESESMVVYIAWTQIPVHVEIELWKSTRMT